MDGHEREMESLWKRGDEKNLENTRILEIIN